jgi:prepilin-type N-terminal cleavage/methylation domain-containing protein
MNIPRLNLRKDVGFTLIELLIVISIIALLASIGVVAGNRVIVKARELEAKTTMTSIEAAILSYKTEYLRMPSVQPGAAAQGNVTIDTTDEDGRALLNLLLGRDAQRNPKATRFWNPSKSSAAGYTAEAGLKDPWGEKGYQIVIDYSGQGRIANPYAGGAGGEPEEITADVIIYCAGANKEFEEEGSSDGKKNDDVRSWQK